MLRRNGTGGALELRRCIRAVIGGSVGWRVEERNGGRRKVLIIFESRLNDKRSTERMDQRRMGLYWILDEIIYIRVDGNLEIGGLKCHKYRAGGGGWLWNEERENAETISRRYKSLSGTRRVRLIIDK